MIAPLAGPATRGDGTFTVPGACIVWARLDNSAAYVSSATLAVQLRLTPVSQLVAVESAAAEEELHAMAAHLEGLRLDEEAQRAQVRARALHVCACHVCACHVCAWHVCAWHVWPCHVWPCGACGYACRTWARRPLCSVRHV